ncbi:MAG: thiol:disulfide interchange protein DsbA/DsbL [Usitatibacter sp.]
MSLRKILATAAATLCLSAPAAFAQQFATLSPPQPTEGGGKIEVIEFFWYGCPHCYTLESSVAAWAKNTPKDVVFKRVPAVPSDSWGEMAKVFYTLEAMGVLEQYHQKVFDAVHRDKVNMGNKKQREEWLVKNGIDPAKYNEVEKSFTVSTKMQRAKQLTYAYKVDSVPRIFVNGKYYTSAEQAGGTQNVFTVVDQLVATSRKELGSAPAAAAAPAHAKK